MLNAARGCSLTMPRGYRPGSWRGSRQASDPVPKHVGEMRPVRPIRPAKGKRAGGMRPMHLSDHDSSDFLTRVHVRAGKVLESPYHKA